MELCEVAGDGSYILSFGILEDSFCWKQQNKYHLVFA